MKKNVLIYTPSCDGHHIEYLHHIFMRCRKISDISFIFTVPEAFRDNMRVVDWPQSNNISFDFAGVPDLNGCNLLKKSAYISLSIKKKIRQHNANYVFCDSLMSLMPFAIVFIPRRIKISGIVYKIYLYEKQSLVDRIKNHLLFFAFSNSRVFERIFVLNDKESALRLNEIYSTDRFYYLPDPVMLLPYKTVENKESLRLSGKKVFAHFGELSNRKGTLTILKSLSYLPKGKLSEYAFIFAGKIVPQIKKEFYQLVEEWKEKVEIIVKDEYCSFDYLFSICSLADCILLPYFETSQSSGVIGYAAAFKKPVIAPGRGLIGELVDNYSLGITCDCTRPEILAEAYDRVLDVEVSDEYLNSHTIESFQSAIVSPYLSE